jgi:hypothetical protein
VVYNSGGSQKHKKNPLRHSSFNPYHYKKSFLINDIATMQRKYLFCLAALVIINAQKKSRLTLDKLQ